MAPVKRKRTKQESLPIPIMRGRSTPPKGAGRPHVIAMKREQQHRLNKPVNKVVHRFQLGNEDWILRLTSGLEKTYDTPEEFMESFKEAVLWNLNNPLFEAKYVSDKGTPELVYIPKVRVMTLFFVITYMGLTTGRWAQMKKDRPDLLSCILRIEEIVRDKKYMHAAAGQLNATLIMRDLGLADTVNSNITNQGNNQSNDESAKANMERLRALHLDNQQ